MGGGVDKIPWYILKDKDYCCQTIYHGRQESNPQKAMGGGDDNVPWYVWEINIIAVKQCTMGGDENANRHSQLNKIKGFQKQKEVMGGGDGRDIV